LHAHASRLPDVARRNGRFAAESRSSNVRPSSGGGNGVSQVPRVQIRRLIWRHTRRHGSIDVSHAHADPAARFNAVQSRTIRSLNASDRLRRERSFVSPTRDAGTLSSGAICSSTAPDLSRARDTALASARHPEFTPRIVPPWIADCESHGRRSRNGIDEALHDLR
jgi:hypothetical protein